MGIEHRLEPPHDLGGLHGMTAGSDIEVDVGKGQPEVSEQLPTHVLVVMLAGMDQECGNRWDVIRQGAQDRRHLHEIGPRADDAHHRAEGLACQSMSHVLDWSEVDLTMLADPTSF